MKKYLLIVVSLYHFFCSGQSISGPSSVNQGDLATYTFSGQIVSNPNWSVSGGSIQAESDTQVHILWGSGPSSGSVTHRDGSSPLLTKTVSISDGSGSGGGPGGIDDPNSPPSAPPAPTISGETCGPRTLSYSVSPSDPSTTWHWQGLVNDDEIIDDVAVNTSYQISSSGTYYIKAKNSHGWSGATGVYVNINDYPETPSSNNINWNTNNCGPAVVSLKSAPNGTSFFWQNGQNSTTVHLSNEQTFTESGSKWVRAKSDAGCWSDAYRVDVTVNDYPNPPTVTQTRFGGHTLLRVSSINGIDTIKVYENTNKYFISTDPNSGCQSNPITIPVDVAQFPSTEIEMHAQLNDLNIATYFVKYQERKPFFTYEMRDQSNNLILEDSVANWSFEEPGIYRLLITDTTAINCYTEIEFGTYINILNEVESGQLLVSGASTLEDVNALPLTQKNINIEYLDGLGRMVQRVARAQSPSNFDIVTPIQYDSLGRQSKAFLPFVAENNSGSYVPDAIMRGTYTQSQQYLFYNNSTETQAQDSIPYAVTFFEESPSNRPVVKGSVGESWQPETGAVSIDYNHKEKIDVWELDENTGLPVTQTTNNSFNYQTITDEEGRKSVLVTNALGQTLLKRVQATEAEKGQWADTYYVYDDYGNLRYVLPPMFNNPAFGVRPNFPDSAYLDLWAFQYAYDGRKRMITKKVPGADMVEMVYDQRDRLVLSRDGNQGSMGQWMFTKYDQQNRPVATGIYESSLSRELMQYTVTNFYSNLNSSEAWYETYVGNNSSDMHGYDNKSFPSVVNDNDYYTITYYDHYDFIEDDTGFDGFTYDSTHITCENTPTGNICFPDSPLEQPLGLVTGTKVLIPEISTYISLVNYYDDKSRLIQSIATDHLGGISRSSQLLNFPGWLISSTNTKTMDSISAFKVKRRFEYDHVGRLLRGYHELIKDGHSNGEILLAENHYNKLGELIEKNLHIKNNVPRQSIDYRYNIRGWLKSINAASLLLEVNKNTNDIIPDLFGMEIYYETPFVTLSE